MSGANDMDCPGPRLIDASRRASSVQGSRLTVDGVEDVSVSLTAVGGTLDPIEACLELGDYGMVNVSLPDLLKLIARTGDRYLSGLEFVSDVKRRFFESQWREAKREALA